MLKVLEDRRNELQAQADSLWSEIKSRSAGVELTEWKLHRSGLDVLFARYNYIDDHLLLYSGAWNNGIMLSDNKVKVRDWLRSLPEAVGLRPSVVERDACLEDERRQALRLVLTLFNARNK